MTDTVFTQGSMQQVGEIGSRGFRQLSCLLLCLHMVRTPNSKILEVTYLLFNVLTEFLRVLSSGRASRFSPTRAHAKR